MSAKHAGNQNTIEILLITVTFAFGLQSIRVVLPGLVWFLGDRLSTSFMDHLGLGMLLLGIIGLAIFSIAFFSKSISRSMGAKRLIVVSVGSLGASRLVMQLCYDLSFVSFIFAIIGTVLFSVFLATWFDYVRFNGGKAIAVFIIGIIAGITLDTALNGAFLTYDMVWRRDLIAILIVALLVLIQWLTLGFFARSFTLAPLKETRQPMVLLSFGPFLFLEFVQFQNIPQFTVITGWPLPLAAIWVLLTILTSLFAILLILSRKAPRWPFVLLISLILLGSTIYVPPSNPWFSATLLLVGQISLSLLFAVIIQEVCSPGIHSRYSNTAVGSGMVLFALLTMGYYAVYLISLPYKNFILVPIAGAIIAVCSLSVSRPQVTMQKLSLKSWVITGVAILLLLPSIANLIVWKEPEPEVGTGFPIRVMSYNLHNGFSADGHFNLESLADVIAENNPDVVALQEVSRGWVISGRVDMLGWLAKRLNMYYVFGPTADPIWGSAVLSKYPIMSWNHHELPPADLYLRRGFIDATLDLRGQPLRIIATHFHHVPGDSSIRQIQVPVILNAWNGRPNTIILGDMNAAPDSPEIRSLAHAGLVDIAAYLNVYPPLTFPAKDPYTRIDYIWTSKDLIPIDCVVPYSEASDHFSIIADVSR
jgi:endonuclease/exonuclease/phosphatase family metal-dependent hydrolase